MHAVDRAVVSAEEASKEAILDGVAERLLEEAQLGTDLSSWQEWVSSFAAAMRRLARAHRGAFGVFTPRPAHGPRPTRTSRRR
ncbi:MAG: hypothetical protein NVS3B26_13670 [Mycobacteriales bacterium]